MGYVGRVFQWKAGEYNGVYEVAESEDTSEIRFESGHTVEKRELAAMMVEQFIPGLGNPEPAGPAMPPGWSPEMLGNPVAPVYAPPTEESIIETILAKQKKTDTLELGLSVALKVPSRTAYEFMCMMYDGDEVSRILAKRAKESVEQQVRELVESGELAGMIEKHYNDKK